MSLRFCKTVISDIDKIIMTDAPPVFFATVSRQLLDDWCAALRPLCSEAQFNAMLQRAGLTPDHGGTYERVTLDQIVSLYQRAAVETGDEMMGLWSRPIRPRALQHLLTSVREATSLASALYRFSTFWNLLLDDYQFSLVETEDTLALTLVPNTDIAAQRFGHMLILKLAHGLMSWLARREVPIKSVDMAFAQPAFHEDYAVIFPAPVLFDATASALTFDRYALGKVHIRSSADLDQFLENAPRDWIFTRSLEHSQTIRVRAYLAQTPWTVSNLTQAAQAMHMTPRTLIRRLDADGTSFQAIKDALRRDIAIRHLQAGEQSIEAIAQNVGFSSAANFHKAFQRWTGGTPSSYRRQRTEET